MRYRCIRFDQAGCGMRDWEVFPRVLRDERADDLSLPPPVAASAPDYERTTQTNCLGSPAPQDARLRRDDFNGPRAIPARADTLDRLVERRDGLDRLGAADAAKRDFHGILAKREGAGLRGVAFPSCSTAGQRKEGWSKPLVSSAQADRSDSFAGCRRGGGCRSRARRRRPAGTCGGCAERHRPVAPVRRSMRRCSRSFRRIPPASLPG